MMITLLCFLSLRGLEHLSMKITVLSPLVDVVLDFVFGHFLSSLTVIRSVTGRGESLGRW